MPSYKDKVVIVDGCSPDHTADVTRALRDDVIVVDEQRKEKGAATIRLSRTSPPGGKPSE
jgi:GT2 family glycosyltransferase